MDSNHRNPKMTDLQSVPFNHSGTYPFLNKCVKNKYYYSGSPRTCQHLFHFLFLAQPDRDIDEAVRADRAAAHAVKLDYLQVTTGMGVKSVACIGLDIAGEKFEASASGNGPVDAAISALKNIIKRQMVLKELPFSLQLKYVG